MARIPAALLAVLACSWVSSASVAVELVPHRALYRITLLSSTRGSDVVGAEGVMAYQFTDACNGWTVENRTAVRFEYVEDRTSETTWSFVSWESRDASRYRFRVHHERDGEAIEDLDGTAQLDSTGVGEATFTEPAGLRFRLPAGTLFPTRHLKVLLEAARAGKRLLALPTFDGSTDQGGFEVSALLSPLPEDEARRMSEVMGLAPMPAWRMQLAFFNLGATGPLPEFEVTVQYRDDGIAERLVQDFGDVQLDLKLREIQLLPKPEC